ncbi:hypothetical protein [Streptomyces acidicola]|uniref:hypothetical protein n=1 Tax=Streptomyces acidicola TaxID=2596892 RepID=UPI003825F4CA
MRVRMAIAEHCESLLLTLVRILLPTRGRHRAVLAQHGASEGMLTATHSPPVHPHPLDVWPFEPDADLVRRWHGVEVAV